MQFRVTATALNLRAAPSPEADRIAVLPQGASVIRLAVAAGDWWHVRVELQGAAVEGFANSKFLAAAETPTDLASASQIGPVHLKENRTDITRDRDGGRAYPIGEPDRPRRLSGDAAARRAGLLAIIDWLNVEQGERWLPAGGTTYCNIYTYDVCYLAGAYLPRVWWTAESLRRLAAGNQVPVAYAETVRELNANALTDWLEDHGPSFGWRRVFELDPLQTTANQGRVAIIAAQRRDLNRSGHIQVIAPEHGEHSARRANGKVIQPLQTQAGDSNFRYGFLGNGNWWAGSAYSKHGFWIQR